MKNCEISLEYDRDLEEDIKGDLGGNLEKLMVSLLCANRENGWDVDNDQAKEDVQRLFEVQCQKQPKLRSSLIWKWTNKKKSFLLLAIFWTTKELCLYSINAPTVPTFNQRNRASQFNTFYLPKIPIPNDIYKYETGFQTDFLVFSLTI